MSKSVSLEKAGKTGQPIPTDFSGAAAAAF
jgi:hypothetical protein